jgi:hypothetical protein
VWYQDQIEWRVKLGLKGHKGSRGRRKPGEVFRGEIPPDIITIALRIDVLHDHEYPRPARPSIGQARRAAQDLLELDEHSRKARNRRRKAGAVEAIRRRRRKEDAEWEAAIEGGKVWLPWWVTDPEGGPPPETL